MPNASTRPRHAGKALWPDGGNRRSRQRPSCGFAPSLVLLAASDSKRHDIDGSESCAARPSGLPLSAASRGFSALA
jgi:hypothetical protein